MAQVIVISNGSKGCVTTESIQVEGSKVSLSDAIQRRAERMLGDNLVTSVMIVHSGWNTVVITSETVIEKHIFDFISHEAIKKESSDS